MDISGYLLLFLFAIMNNATNIRVPGFAWPCVFIPLGLSLGMELLGHMVTLCWNLPLEIET